MKIEFSNRAALLIWALCATARAAQVDQPAVAWDVPPERQRLSSVTDTAQAAITIALAARSPMGLPAEGFVAAQGPVGVFTGDLRGIAAVSFRLVTDGHDLKGASVWLRGANSGRIWISRHVAWTNDPAQGVVNVIPLQRQAGGWGEGDGPALDAQWAEDLGNVDLLGVRVTQLGSAAANCAVSGFTLVTQAGGTRALPLARLDAALWARYGVLTAGAVSATQAAADSDGDGMTDLSELVAGTNPDSAGSVFAARIEAGADGAVVQWPCVADGVYTLSRADALDQAFAPVAGAEALRPTADEASAGTMTYTDATASAAGRAYFYRVSKQ